MPEASRLSAVVESGALSASPVHNSSPVAAYPILPRANPIFLREMRDAMRAEAKADPWQFKLLIPGVLVTLAAYGAVAVGLFSPTVPLVAYYALAFFESILVMNPAQPMGIIQRERQQNTFEPLFLTPLTPTRYLAGQMQFQLAHALRRMAQVLPFFAALYVLQSFPLGQFLGFQALLLAYSAMSHLLTLAIANALPSAGGEAGAAGAAGGSAGGGAGSGGPSALSRKLGGRRGNAMGAGANPLTFIPAVLTTIMWIVISVATRGNLTPTLAVLGTPAAPPGLDGVKALAVLHPFLALGLWGDALVFGRPVPVALVCLTVWGLVAQAAALTFVHQLTLRKFRAARGYRLGRWLLAAGLQVVVAGVFWRTPVVAALMCALLATLYGLIRFGNPNAVPSRDRERYQLLPGRDVLVHRAGNLPAFLLAVMAPSWAMQALLVTRADIPGWGLVVFYANAAVLLTVAMVLIGGAIFRLKAERRRVEKEARLDAGEAAGEQPQAGRRGLAFWRRGRSRAASHTASGGGTDAAKKSVSTPGNAAFGLAMLVWMLPIPLVIGAPFLSATPAAGLVPVIDMIVEPLKLVNAPYVVVRLVQHHGVDVAAHRPLKTADPAVLAGILPPGSGADFYVASLVANLIILLGLVTIYARSSRRLDKVQRSVDRRAAEA